MKNVLLFIIIMFCSQVNAQFTVWEDDFNDGEANGWTLLDLDENASNWFAGNNIQLTGDGIVEGSIEILGTYNIDMSTGGPLAEGEDNWAISPVQDLSFYTGTVQLVINAQTSVYGGDHDLFVFVSNSADPASFLENDPVTINLDRDTDEGEEFEDYIVDISGYAGSGQSAVYIALVTDEQLPFVGIEINNIKITATEILGNHDLTKTKTRIKQNPVPETLQLQLGSMINGETVNLQIYNANGMLVKDVTYTEMVSVSNLAGGMYFAVLNDGNTIERLKFVKK